MNTPLATCPAPRTPSTRTRGSAPVPTTVIDLEAGYVLIAPSTLAAARLLGIDPGGARNVRRGVANQLHGFTLRDATAQEVGRLAGAEFAIFDLGGAVAHWDGTHLHWVAGTVETADRHQLLDRVRGRYASHRQADGLRYVTPFKSTPRFRAMVKWNPAAPSHVVNIGLGFTSRLEAAAAREVHLDLNPDLAAFNARNRSSAELDQAKTDWIAASKIVQSGAHVGRTRV